MHISLFFVDERYHRKGIGRALFEYMLKYTSPKQLIVHVAPYAVEIYRRLGKVIPIEVKSSSVKNHKSIDSFETKYSKCVGERYLLSQKDVGNIGTLRLKPIYMILFLLKDLQ